MVSYGLIFILTLMMSQKHYPIAYSYNRILIVFIPTALIIGVTYYYNLKILPRLIIAIIFVILSSAYFYNNYKDSDEFKLFLNKIKKLKSFSSKQNDQSKLEI